MKTKSILLALALCLVVSGCQKDISKDNKVSEETIAKALDGKVDFEKPSSSKKSDADSEDDTEKKDKKEQTADLLRNYMTKIGEFDPSFTRELDDDEIIDFYKEADKISKNTGYWDVKDFFFQEIAKAYPGTSLKFPLDSVASKYLWKAASDNGSTEKFEYERNYLVEEGYDYNTVWSFTDKEMEDAFHAAYKKNPRAYYEDYVEMAYDILTSDDKDAKEDKDSKEEGAADPAEYKNLLKFGSSETDYKALKEALVNHYEFDKKIVEKIPNKDIDLAYTRAQKRLEKTGFGDIGLIFDELGKLYPGASTMYPGE